MAVLVPFIFGAIGSSLAAGTAYTALAYAVGATIGTMLVAPKGQDQRAYGARLMDLKATHTEYGSPIHIKLGQSRGAGTIIWQSDFRELATTTTQEQDGCCGGGSSSSYTNYTYFVDLMLLLNDIPTAALARVWLNSELVYNVRSDADDTTVINSVHKNNNWSEIQFYSGAPDQLPDPHYEAAKGVGNAPAHRGAATVFIKNLALGANDQLPSLEFELFENATFIDVRDVVQVSTIPTDALTANGVGSTIYNGKYVYIHDAATGANVVDLHIIDDATKTKVIKSYTLPFDMAAYNTFQSNGYLYIFSTNIYPPTVFFAINQNYDLVETGGFSGSGSSFAVKIGLYIYVVQSWGDVRKLEHSGIHSGIYNLSDVDLLTTWGSIDKFFGVYASGCAVVDDSIVILGGYAGNCQAVSLNTITDTFEFSWNSANVIVEASSVISDDNRSRAVHFLNGEKFAIYDVDIGTATYHNFTFPVGDDFTGVGGELSGPSVYDADNDWYIVGYRESGDAGLLIIDPTSLQTIGAYKHEENFWPYKITKGSLHRPQANRYYVIGTNSSGEVRRLYYGRDVVTATSKTLQETVAQLCDMSGLPASDIDVTALSAITTPVEGLTITGATSMRQPIEALMGSYYFTACQSGDKIKFTPRGGGSLATFDYEELGASFGDSSESPLSFNMASDTELPSRVSVTYQVLEGDYQKDTQMSDRLVTAETNTVSDVMLPIIMSAEQAKGVAITNALDAQMSLMSAKIKVLFDHPELEPGDVVTVTDRDGSQYRMRITQIMDSFPIRELDLVLDDASILTYSGITTADFFTQSVVLPLVDSDGLYLDIPILSDINNDAGFYVVSGPVAEGKWYGAVTLQSDNDLDYVSGVVVPERGYFGSCTTTLGDWTGYHVFDEMNSVTISIQTDAVLTNSTRAGILASPLTNAFLIGNEIIQAVNCTEISAGVWKLTRLLRGLRGTEWAMVDHTAGERAVWLRSSGMRRLPMTNSRLGLTRYYKTFSNNRSAADYDGEAFVNMAIGMKPFSPTTARGARDLSGNLTITWQRRTRLSCRYGGAMGVSIPLGENTELYEIDIFSDNTYTEAIRGFASTTPTCEYTAAQQVIDFGSAQAVVYVKIYQISQVVDRGYALTGAV